MSSLNKDPGKRPAIIDFYTSNLKDFGNSAKGVGWKNDEAQLIRFSQLSKVINAKPGFSLNDLGCGTGRLYEYLMSEGQADFTYRGYDILEEMIQAARKNLTSGGNISLARINSPDEMERSDYSVASGIFNVKYGADNEEWLRHVLLTLDAMDAKSSHGFSFNLLTKYSDAEFMQPHLYYADPLMLFDYCKRKYAKNVALLHDYYQYDFTIIVRKT